MENNTIEKILNGNYDNEYKKKLIYMYNFFNKYNYEFRVHALNRILGQKTGKNKREFKKEEILHILKEEKINYIEKGRYIRYYNNIAIIQAIDNGEIITIVTTKKPSKLWKEVKIW